MIKKTAKLLVEGEHSFNESFEDNKRKMGRNTMPSKSTRNKIAGYIARLVKMKRMEKEALLNPKPKKIEMPEYESERPRNRDY